MNTAADFLSDWMWILEKRYSIPNLPNEPETEARTPDPQTENLPLVCNNIQDLEQEQRRQVHNENNFPRSLRPHQDQNPVLRNLKLKIFKENYDAQLLHNDPRAAKYQAQEDRIIIKDGLLCRQYFGDTGKKNFYKSSYPINL